MMRNRGAKIFVMLLWSVSVWASTCKAGPLQVDRQPLPTQPSLIERPASELLLDQLKRDPQATPAQVSAAEKALFHLRALHVGVSRAALLKVVHEEGGISTANMRRYVILLGPGKDGRYGQCIRVTATFVSQRNYVPWLRKHADFMTSRLAEQQDTTLYQGFLSGRERPDGVVINLSQPSIGVMVID